MARRRMAHMPADDGRFIDDEEEEEEYEGADGAPLPRGAGGTQIETGFSALSEGEQDEIVKRLVRFMICRNTKKKPVKRADLSKYIFNDMVNVRAKHKTFQGAFNSAQQSLRNLFGVEIVEIVKQVKRSGPSQTARSQTQASQGGGAANKAYILVSVLPQKARVENEKNWPSIGFLTVLASIIVLEPGCRIEQDRLYNALERIGVFVKERSGHKQLNNGNVKDLIENQLPSQWYLEREKEDRTFYYTLGPRLRAELDDDDIILFIQAVYQGGGSAEKVMDATSKKELKLRLDNARGALGAGVED